MKQKIELDYSKIEVLNIEGLNYSDYPDFCDAYISSANYGGREMTDEELDALNEDSEFVYEAVIARIY